MSIVLIQDFFRLLVHLKLCSKPVKQRTPQAPSPDLPKSVKYVSCDDGWAGYEEPVVDVKSL
jgi:hypothetical protein